MATSTISNENASRIINVLAEKRAALFAQVWNEGGRDFTADEQGTLDLANNALLFAEPETRNEAGAVLETAIEQLQLFRHGDPDVSLPAVEGALLKVLGVLNSLGDYTPAIFSRPAVLASH